MRELRNGIGAGTTELHVFRAIDELVSPDYVLIFLKSPLFINEGIPRMTGSAGQKRITRDYFAGKPFPLPPLKEQKRIVAKVDQLMALCNELEARQQKQQQGRVRLNNSALDALLTAREPDEFADHWQRISTNFDLLYDHPETIAKLRAAILQLAVQGKLVPQDPNDEPASVLLERIKAEKERLVNARVIKEKTSDGGLSYGAIPDMTPPSWMWTSLGVLVTVMDAGWSPACPKGQTHDENTWGVLKTTAVQALNYLWYEHKELPSNLKPRPQYEVRAGDILITRAGPKNRVGICCLVKETRKKLMISDKIIRFHLVDGLVFPDFYALCLNSGFSRDCVERQKSGMAESQMNISHPKLRKTPVPLPPFEEQKRIVAKVDQLMALCDELEAKLNQAQQHSEKLMEATVRQLLGTSTPQKPHTSRAPAAPAAGKSVRPARHAYQPAPAIAEPIAAETAVVYGGSVPETILAAMQPGQEYSRAAILAATSIREADWMWAIKQLKEQRRVAQTGEKRGARYRLK
jgi:type I restriction enzyme S subunit